MKKKCGKNLKCEWYKIDFQKFEYLSCKMPRICKAVIAAKDGYIDKSKL